MFTCARDLLEAVWQWAGDEHDPDAESSWDFGVERVTGQLSATFDMWHAWRFHNTPPLSGGWMDQPLDVLMEVHVINIVFDTRQFMLSKGADWSKLTATQKELVRWLKRGE